MGAQPHDRDGSSGRSAFAHSSHSHQSSLVSLAAGAIESRRSISATTRLMALQARRLEEAAELTGWMRSVPGRSWQRWQVSGAGLCVSFGFVKSVMASAFDVRRCGAVYRANAFRSGSWRARIVTWRFCRGSRVGAHPRRSRAVRIRMQLSIDVTDLLWREHGSQRSLQLHRPNPRAPEVGQIIIVGEGVEMSFHMHDQCTSASHRFPHRFGLHWSPPVDTPRRLSATVATGPSSNVRATTESRVSTWATMSPKS